MKIDHEIVFTVFTAFHCMAVGLIIGGAIYPFLYRRWAHKNPKAEELGLLPLYLHPFLYVSLCSFISAIVVFILM